ncbi:MAG: hypothetical protein E4G94_06940 [ANME-2 cluster archaeon]|nr:MAG: hypothetical protein E4G94_06940 [ANME-2 cluster archaeon]
MTVKIEKTFSLVLTLLFAVLFAAAPVVAGDCNSENDEAVFEMPVYDVQKMYIYNTTFDQFAPYRIGQEAVLYWGDTARIDGSKYYVSNIVKIGGEEINYFEVDNKNKDLSLKGIVDIIGPITFMDLTFEPESLFYDYPLYSGKTWVRETVNFSGTVWMMGSSVNVTGTTWGLASVTGDETISVPGGDIHCLVVETTMDSLIPMDHMSMYMNTSEKIWLMEDGFFAKRQLYKDGALIEELELKSTSATVTLKPETLNLKSKGVFTAIIELQEHDVADVNLNTVECEGAPAVDGSIEGGRLVVKFSTQDLDVAPGDGVLLTVTGELNDGTPFGGWDRVDLI